MMENLNRINLSGFSLPVCVGADNEYYGSLHDIFRRYIKTINDKSEVDDKCKREVEYNCECIENAIAYYYNAEFLKAENEIDKLLKKYINSPFIVSSLNENYAFRGLSPTKLRPGIYRKSNAEMYDKMMNESIILFRARVKKNKLNHEEMLHIPLNKRELVMTQRFSMPGIPCFYFSTTTYGAWLELGEPDKSIFQVSAFEIPSNVKVLNLCQQQLFIDGAASYIETKNERRNLYDFLEIFPLVIASSYRVNDSNRNFKSEYIVSQLVMQVAKKLQIDGVAYLSKKLSDYYAYPQCVNLAILIPYERGSESCYWKRINEVKWTNSFYLKDMPKNGHEEHQTLINKYYTDAPHKMVESDGETISYYESDFSRFDDYLCNQPRMSL